MVETNIVEKQAAISLPDVVTAHSSLQRVIAAKMDLLPEAPSEALREVKEALERATVAIDLVQNQETQIRELFESSEGVFIGAKELGLGKELPPIQYTREFLTSDHPMREGKCIMDSCALSFDVDTNKWHLVELDIIPGSLGPEGQGLSGDEQDKLVKDINVAGGSLSSPEDSYPFERIIDKVIEIKTKAGVQERDLPLYGVWARTADTKRAAAGCRVLVGDSNAFSTDVDDICHAGLAGSDVGLGGVWN